MTNVPKSGLGGPNGLGKYYLTTDQKQIMTANEIYDWLALEYKEDAETVAYIQAEKASIQKLTEAERWPHAAQLETDLWNWW